MRLGTLTMLPMFILFVAIGGTLGFQIGGSVGAFIGGNIGLFVAAPFLLTFAPYTFAKALALDIIDLDKKIHNKKSKAVK